MNRILSPRPLTPGDLAARDQAPRPGTWYGDPHADGRALTQHETDLLIRRELVSFAWPAEHRDIEGIVGAASWIPLASGWRAGHPFEAARTQRGGIDSDPAVRVLAYRAWGDRDHTWLDLRGVRVGDRVTIVDGLGDAPDEVALAWSGEPAIGIVELAKWQRADQTVIAPGRPVDVRPDRAAVGGASVTLLPGADQTRPRPWPHLHLRVSGRLR